MQHCDAKCGWCARNYFKWLKARIAQMRVPRKAKLDPETLKVLRPAETISFDECAETSLGARRAAEKEASREADLHKTQEQLKAENGAFAFPRDRIVLDLLRAKKVY